MKDRVQRQRPPKTYSSSLSLLILPSTTGRQSSPLSHPGILQASLDSHCSQLTEWLRVGASVPLEEPLVGSRARGLEGVQTAERPRSTGSSHTPTAVGWHGRHPPNTPNPVSEVTGKNLCSSPPITSSETIQQSAMVATGLPPVHQADAAALTQLHCASSAITSVSASACAAAAAARAAPGCTALPPTPPTDPRTPAAPPPQTLPRGRRPPVEASLSFP